MVNDWYPSLGVFFTQRIVGGTSFLPYDVSQLELKTEIIFVSKGDEIVITLEATTLAGLAQQILAQVEARISPTTIIYSPHFNSLLGPLMKWGAWGRGSEPLPFAQAVDVVEAFWYPRFLTMEARTSFNYEHVIQWLGWDSGFLSLCHKGEELDPIQWQNTQRQLASCLTQMLHLAGQRGFPRA